MGKRAPSEQKPKVPGRRKFLTPEEANRLIAAAGKRGRYPFRDKVLVRLTYRHGMRAGEAVGLRWEHIDLDNGVIIIYREKSDKKSTHTIDRDELRDLRTLRKSSNGPWVFETERGGPLSVDALQYIVREAGKLAKLPVTAHPHMLRHAAGYYLINNDTDVRLVQDFLGHKAITTTTIYTEVTPARLRAVRVR